MEGKQKSDRGLFQGWRVSKELVKLEIGTRRAWMSAESTVDDWMAWHEQHSLQDFRFSRGETKTWRTAGPHLLHGVTRQAPDPAAGIGL